MLTGLCIIVHILCVVFWCVFFVFIELLLYCIYYIVQLVDLVCIYFICEVMYIICMILFSTTLLYTSFGRSFTYTYNNVAPSGNIIKSTNECALDDFCKNVFNLNALRWTNLKKIKRLTHPSVIEILYDILSCIY